MVWYNECGKTNWMESFTHHPRIGDKKSLEKKFAGRAVGCCNGTDAIIDALLMQIMNTRRNSDLFFIVCATGRSAEEMLRLMSG